MNISVIVPVYNAEKTIEKTIRALVAQTYSEFEVLMVDNGSTDRSSQICLEYQKKDKRFRYIYVEQKGVSNARNMGLSCAKGKYICFCDADDVPKENMLQVLLQDIETSQSDCVMCNYYTERDNCNSVFPFKSDKSLDVEEIREKLIPAMFTCSLEVPVVWGTVWRCIFKNSLIRDIRLKFDSKLTFAEDLCFVIEYLSNANKVYLENKVLYYYSLTDGSAMLSFNQYKPYLFKERVWLIQKISMLLNNIKVYQYMKSDVETIFQEYILECIGNATVKSENRSLIESFKDVKNIVSNECVVHVFSKIYTQDKRHRIVFKMIQLKMSVLLTLYYSIRRG